MEEGFLFDGIDMDGDRIAVAERVEESVTIYADAADAPLPHIKNAPAGAQVALDYPGINHLLGNTGTTVDINQYSLQRQGDESKVSALVTAMNNGEVDALIVYGANPVYELPFSRGGSSLVDRLIQGWQRGSYSSA